MPAARYWRLVGCAPYGHDSDLSISELGLYEAATRQDTGPTCTYAPISGSLSSLADNSTGTLATFAAEDLTKANFGFYWDLGSSANVDSLVVGSAAARSTFLARALLQMSADGIYWRPVSTIRGLIYQGPNSFSTVSNFKFADPDALCRFNGANGEKVVEASIGTIPPFTFGTNVQLSTVEKYEGSSSMSFPGGQTLLTQVFPGGTSFTGQLATDVFTVGAWIYPTQFDGRISGSFNSTGANQSEGWTLSLLSSGALSGAVYIYGQPSYPVSSAAGLIQLNSWQHVVFEREQQFARLYVDGVKVAEVSNLPPTPIGSSLSRGLGIGSLNSNLANVPFKGFIDDFFISGSYAFFGGFDFTPEPWNPQTGDEPDAHALEPNTSLPAADRDIKLFTPQSVNTQLRETLPSESRNDMIFGGRGVINGTVKEKSTPANLPLFRKVRLIDERSGYVVAETWSDATTGNYSFANIDRSRTYTVVSYDHTGLYRAVIADRLTPELMT